MKCNETYALIHDCLDGALDEAKRQAFDAHVAGCATCSTDVSAYREIDGLLGQLEVAEVPMGFSSRVISKLKANGRITAEQPAAALRKRFGGVPWSWRLPAAVTAALLVAAFVFPSTIGMLTGMAGKGAVMATDTYVEVQEQAARAGVLRSVVDGLVTTASMFKTIGMAFFSVLGTLGSVFKFPVFALVLFLTVGAGLYVRIFYRRGVHHASLSI